MLKPDIFRSYDVRGIVPQDLDADGAYAIGRAYAQYTGAKRVVVARDMRPTGDQLEPAMIKGLTDGGTNVIKIGLATSPLFYFAVHKLKADGGVMVTASHNPGEYNGAKMTREQAIPIAGNSGLFDIRDLALAGTWEAVETPGTIEEANVTDEYIAMATDGASAKGLKIVIDAGNGMTGHILPQVTKKIGGDIIPLYWELDGTFPNHEADPLKEENMADLQKAVKEQGADLGVAFDGDGDRVFFCTEQGDIVPGDITEALIATEVLKEHPGTPVIYDIRASRTTPEVIKEAGGEPIMWHVGHSLIKPKMRETGAYFAGEVSGHYFFAPWFAESAMLAFNYVLKLIQEKKQPFSAIVQPLLRYAKTPEINFDVTDKDAVLKKLREKYSDADKVYDFDGIRIEYPDWWFNVRPSNTEPKLRLNMEANTPELLQEKQQEIEAIIKG